MHQFQTLYKQSLVLIQKQKQQIRKLQEEIRERCQSYLIYSSRYKSRRNDQQYCQNSNSKSELIQSKSSAGVPSSDQNLHKLLFVYNIVNIEIGSNIEKKQPVDEGIQTVQQLIKTKKLHHTPSIEKEIKQDGIYQNNRLVIKNSIQDLSSIKQKQSEASNQSISIGPLQKTISLKQNGQVTMNWAEVIQGLKQRISLMQKIKSEQSQRINELEQQIRLLKKQQNNKLQTTKPNKVRQTLIFQQTNNISFNQGTNLRQKLTSLLQNLKNKLNYDSNLNIQQNFSNLILYVNQIEAKIKLYQEKEEQRISDTSKVQSYSFNTPYRKLKVGQSNISQDKDAYEEDELQMLRRKCKQLEAQLTQSRAQKDLSPLQSKAKYNQQTQEKQIDNQQEIVHEPAYLIQQQLQKPNDPYVKRNFVRKKLVKRNLSAMILRTTSRSKQESKASMTAQLEKLKTHIQKSKDGKNDKQILSLSRKVQKLQNNIRTAQQKIEQKSDEESSIARTSGISQGYFTQIIQIQTEGPGFKNYTAHILGLSQNDKSIQSKKQKQSPYI